MFEVDVNNVSACIDVVLSAGANHVAVRCSFLHSYDGHSYNHHVTFIVR